MQTDRLSQLNEAGVSLWLDFLSRELVAGDGFRQLIADRHVTGATSNPTIFAAAITSSDAYDRQIADLAAAGERDAGRIFLTLAVDDVRSGAQALRPTYEDSGGHDGFVSLECTPDVANDATATVTQARDLARRLDAPNTMIKVPGTSAGVEATKVLTSIGVNVNVTLLFSIRRYKEIVDAYMEGLEARVAAGKPVGEITSVASFFLSRIDSAVDARLPDDSPARGSAAIASARRAYDVFRDAYATARWRRLAAAGARPQRLLWASTATKDPKYSDVRYVEQLVGPDVISTVPPKTLDAFADHGDVKPTLPADRDDTRQALEMLAAAGIDLEAVAADLQDAGVAAFASSYEQLVDCIAHKLTELTTSAGTS